MIANDTAARSGGLREEARGIRRVAGSDQAIRRGRRGRRYIADHRAWSSRVPARSVGLRQDDNAATDRRLRRAERRRNPRRRQARLLTRALGTPRKTQHVDDLSELRVVAAYDSGREHRLWPEAAKG